MSTGFIRDGVDINKSSASISTSTTIEVSNRERPMPPTSSEVYSPRKPCSAEDYINFSG